MSRKVIHADEGILAPSISKGSSTKVMTDIMFYLRKILKLARRAQALGLTEGSELMDIEREFQELKEEIDSNLGA